MSAIPKTKLTPEDYFEFKRKDKNSQQNLIQILIHNFQISF